MKVDPRRLGLSPEDLAALGYAMPAGSDARDRGPAPRIGRVSSSDEVTGAVPDEAWIDSAPPLPVPTATARLAGRKRWIAVLLGTAALVWAVSPERAMPRPSAATAPDTVFSSGRAMTWLSELGRSPRPPGSAEHARVRGVIRQRLGELGLRSGEQAAPSVALSAPAAGIVDGTRVRNVVARVDGVASTGAVLVVAPYDSPPLTSASGSGAAGVATLLEVARALSAAEPLRNDVVFLFADGASLGGAGARVFAEGHPWMADVAYAVTVDPHGGRGASWWVPFEGRSAPAGVSGPTASLVAFATPGGLEGGMRSILASTGIPGVTLYSPDGGASGTVLDVVERVDERAVADQGARLLELVRAEGMRDMRTPRSVSPVPPSVTPVGWMGSVSIDAGWTLPLAALLLVTWAGLVTLIRRKGVRPARLRAGLLLGVVSVMVGAAFAGAVVEALGVAHPEFGRIPGGVFEPGLQALAAVAGVTAIVTVLYGLARFRFGLADLYLGALAVPVAGVVWVALAAPEAAGTAQLATGVALGQAAMLLALRRPRLLRFVPAVALASSGVLFSLSVPAVRWATPALFLSSPELWGALVTTAVLLVLPVLEGFLTPRRLAAPVSLAAACVGLLALGHPNARGAERHPELTSLALLVDGVDSVELAPRGSRNALEAASFLGGNDPTPRVVLAQTPRRLAGSWLTVPGSGEAWARSWAVPGSEAPRAPDGLLLPHDDAWVMAGAGPVAEVSAPRVRVVERSFDGRRHEVVLEVHSGLGGVVTGVRLPDDLPASIRAIEDRQLGPASSVRAVRWWGHTRGTPLRLTLRVAAGAPAAGLDIVEHHLAPRDILGDEFFDRGRKHVPDAGTGSDRIVQRTRVTIPLGSEVMPARPVFTTAAR